MAACSYYVWGCPRWSVSIKGKTEVASGVLKKGSIPLWVLPQILPPGGLRPWSQESPLSLALHHLSRSGKEPGNLHRGTLWIKGHPSFLISWMQWLSYQRHTMTLKIIRFLLPIITTQLGVIISTCSSQKPNTLNFREKRPYWSDQKYIQETGFGVLILNEKYC